MRPSARRSLERKRREPGKAVMLQERESDRKGPALRDWTITAGKSKQQKSEPAAIEIY